MNGFAKCLLTVVLSVCAVLDARAADAVQVHPDSTLSAAGADSCMAVERYPEAAGFSGSGGVLLAGDDRECKSEFGILPAVTSDTLAACGTSAQEADSLTASATGRSWGIFNGIKQYVDYLKADKAVFMADSGSVFGRTFRALDRFLIWRQQLSDFDTLYLSKPQDKWSFRTGFNYKENRIYGIGRLNGTPVTVSLQSRPEVSQSFSAAYRGLGFSFTINPASFFGEKEDIGLGFSWYGQSWGYQIEAVTTKSFSGKVFMENDSGQDPQDWLEFDVPRGNVNLFKLSASAYYVFNNKRFSYPAVVNQGYVQKRSSGSFFLNTDLKWGMLHAGSVEGLGNSPIDMNYLIWGLGGGYGYNYVFDNGLMLHASVRASLVVLNSSRFKIMALNKGMHFSFPDFACNGMFGMVYPFGKWYMGMFYNVNDDSIGDTKHVLFEDLRLWGRLMVGVRF